MSRQTPPRMGQPQEIPDAEHEQLVARVCAIDVGKQTGKVCTRVPHLTQPPRRLCTVWNLPGRPTTDKPDAVWLAKLTEKGMLRPSFVPPARCGSCATTPGCAST